MATAAGAENFNLPSYATDPGVTSYTVMGLPTPGVDYYFVVRAHDTAGNMDSNTVEVHSKPGTDTIPPVFAGCTSAVTLNSTEITVSWDPATDNTTLQPQIAYDVFATTTSGQEVYTTPTATFTGANVGVVAMLHPATTYYFVCRARDLSGNEDANTSERTATTPVDTTPPTFAGLSSITGVTATSVQLGWVAATDPQTPTPQIRLRRVRGDIGGGRGLHDPDHHLDSGGDIDHPVQPATVFHPLLGRPCPRPGRKRGHEHGGALRDHRCELLRERPAHLHAALRGGRLPRSRQPARGAGPRRRVRLLEHRQRALDGGTVPLPCRPWRRRG